MEFNYNIEGGNFSRAGTASSEVKKILKQLNVNPAVLKRIVVALYEAEVNVVAHAYEGTMQVSIDPTVITVVISDRGPGIPDIDLAMQEGYSTASDRVRQLGFGAGMGLPNMKRYTDSMQIDSIVSQRIQLARERKRQNKEQAGAVADAGRTDPWTDQVDASRGEYVGDGVPRTFNGEPFEPLSGYPTPGAAPAPADPAAPDLLSTPSDFTTGNAR